MTIVRTARLTLEPVTTRNAGELWQVMQCPDLREFQDVPRLAREEFERRVGARPKRLHARAAGRFEWLIYGLKPRIALGWISLRLGDQPPGAAELGYSLLSAHRGRGYATEATRAIVEAAFTTSDIARVDACCVPDNAPSRRLLARLGFAHTKVERNGAVVRGTAVDVMVFELKREEWAAQGGSANSIVIPASRNPR